MNTETKPTRYYLCSDSPIGVFSAIYDAGRSCYGHKFIRILPLAKDECYEQQLFAEYITVEESEEKMTSVLDAIRQKISHRVYEYVVCAGTSTFADRGDVIYQFITYGFSMGNKICDAIQIPFVKRMFEIQRRVQNEAHYHLEFIRFREVQKEPSLLVATIEPTHHILPMIMDHFCERFSEEYFIIFDCAHQEAVFHMQGQNWALRNLTDEEATQLYNLCEQQEDYIDLWKTFLESITIDERKNTDLQRNLMPLHYRKHLTEFL